MKTIAVLSLALALAACDEETPTTDAGAGVDSGDTPTDSGAPPVVATLPSRGSSVAINEAGTTVAAANKATDDVTLFDPTDMSERARVSVGDEPVSVTFSPDGDTLYVVNRTGSSGVGSVSVVIGADGDSPSVDATIDVGSEAGLAALSPTGATLYVTSWVDGTLTVIDTASRAVTETTVLGGNPLAVCVTNDGDEDDDDETIFVPDFYSRPASAGVEATDRGREAHVFRLAASDPSTVAGTTVLQPIEVTGINTEIDAAATAAFPNQLYSCAINGDRVYVTAVGASPESFNGGTDFHQNIHGLVYAIQIADGAVDAAQTVNLNELIAAQSGEKRFAAVPDDIAFVDGTNFGYVSVMTANAVIRVDFGQSPPVAGSSANFLATDPSPTGIAIGGGIAYTYNEVGRSVTEIDLPSQAPVQSVESAPQPSASTSEADALRGQRFFNTGLARWSTAAWVGCVGCHPGGTTDNVTWVFPAGPRQTVDTSATFNRVGDTQRILNWTAIFDEVHDFELNTRGVAGGVGAIVSDAGLDAANRIDFVESTPGALNPTNAFNVGSAQGINDRDGVPLADWDEIETYIRSIRSPRGASVTEGDATAGLAVFTEGNCANCHGGVLWTLSERYYDPLVDTDARLLNFDALGITSIGDVNANTTVLDDLGFDTPIVANDANGPPQRHLCVVRTVGTFDADGPNSRGAAEVRQGPTPPVAQGADGYNVPSLLNTGLGAPYLHNGAAETLEELLDPSGSFVTHLQSGNQIFSPDATEVADLIAFLRTIDDFTSTIAVPSGHQLCPTGIGPTGTPLPARVP